MRPLAKILSTAKHFSAQEGYAAEAVKANRVLMKRARRNRMLSAYVGFAETWFVRFDRFDKASMMKKRWYQREKRRPRS
jgi:hypothetical protein